MADIFQRNKMFSIFGQVQKLLSGQECSAIGKDVQELYEKAKERNEKSEELRAKCDEADKKYMQKLTAVIQQNSMLPHLKRINFALSAFIGKLDSSVHSIQDYFRDANATSAELALQLKTDEQFKRVCFLELDKYIASFNSCNDQCSEMKRKVEEYMSKYKQIIAQFYAAEGMVMKAEERKAWHFRSRVRFFLKMVFSVRNQFKKSMARANALRVKLAALFARIDRLKAFFRQWVEEITHVLELEVRRKAELKRNFAIYAQKLASSENFIENTQGLESLMATWQGWEDKLTALADNCKGNVVKTVLQFEMQLKEREAKLKQVKKTEAEKDELITRMKATLLNNLDSIAQTDAQFHATMKEVDEQFEKTTDQLVYENLQLMQSIGRNKERLQDSEFLKSYLAKEKEELTEKVAAQRTRRSKFNAILEQEERIQARTPLVKKELAQVQEKLAHRQQQISLAKENLLGLASMEGEGAALAREKDECYASLMQLREQVDQLNAEKASLEDVSEQQKARLPLLESQVEDLDEMNAKKKEKVEAKAGKLKEASQRFALEEEKLGNVSKERLEKAESAKSLRKKLESLTWQLNEEKLKFAGLKKEVKKKKTRVTNLKKSLNSKPNKKQDQRVRKGKTTPKSKKK